MIHTATQTFSTLFDAQHFIHPKDLKEKHDHDQPTLFRRIMGVVLVALSIPFTLGIATVFFAYWAHRKVVHVKEQDRSDLDIRVAAAFPKAVKGEEKSKEQGAFEAALSALYRGDKSTLLEEVGKIEESQLTPEMKNALIAAAISYDRVDEFDALWTKFSSVRIPLNEAKSPAMIAQIVDNIKGDKKAYVNKKYDRGNTALHYQYNLGVVSALLEREAGHLQNAEGQTPLHMCTDPKIAEKLIEHFGDDILEVKDAEGRTPLFTVPVEVKKVLIKKGADVTATDNNGKTLLHYFSESPLKDHPNFLKKILEKVPADDKKNFVNIQDKDGVVALSFAKSLSVAKALVKAGAEYPEEGSKYFPLATCEDPELAEFLIEKFGKEILMRKDHHGRISLIVNVNPEVVKIMIREIEDITAFKDSDGDNILTWFALEPLRDHPKLIHDVLKRVKKDELIAFVNHKNNKNLVPLNHKRLPSEVVKALVEAGAEYVKEGVTSPLHVCEDPELAEFLIKKIGKDVLMQKNENGWIPLLVNPNPEVLKVMIREIEDITIPVDSGGHTILHYFDGSVLRDSPELVDAVLARIKDTEARTEFVNKPNASGWTPLMYRIPLYVVKALLTAGAEYYVENKGTHLHYCQDLENAEHLLDTYGVKAEHLERKDAWGRTPLMTQRNPDIVKLLIEKGANVEAVNGENGFQPLFYAKSVEEAQALIKRGAKLDVKADKGRSVLFGMISPQVAQWLIDDNGFNVLDTDEEGNQPIHCLGNFDSNVELAKVLMGDRDKDHDWQDNKPAILENAKFSAWLEAGKK